MTRRKTMQGAMKSRLAGALALTWLSACSASNFETPGPITAKPLYQSMFPYYAELCAVSQIRKKPGFGPDISGGPGGHSVLFLSGVCLDHDAHYPVLKMCDTSIANHPDGVGLSVNAHYRNANWVATERSAFFFDGTLKPGQRLTRAVYADTQRQAEALGILDGIVFHDRVFEGKPAAISRRDWMYEMSVSTDYAVDFGRGRYCSRVPVTPDQMTRMVGFLNGRNAIYRDGRTPFLWSVLKDNCTHLTHNALAAAGVWNEWKINRPLLISAFSFPVPKNEYVNLMQRTNELPLTDLAALFRDAGARRSLMRSDWLATQPGSITESEAPRRDNDIYNTSLQLIFYDDPILGSYRPNFERFQSQPRYHDLRTNLAYFASLYARIRAERKPLDWWLVHHPALARSPNDFPAFYRQYYGYVDAQSARVEAALATPPSPNG